ncbi:MAG: cytidine deaminase [Bacteroidales bacterium]|nr:cytidine deaminase [Bacteroidales bacterium]
MKKFEIKSTIYEYDSINDLAKEEKILIKKAREAAKKSYAPYSNFNVGACVLLENGEYFQGNNQENAAYPSGLCAERVALFYVNSKFPDIPVKAIAISVYSNSAYLDIPVPPCGSCRQVILETEMRFNSPIKIILAGEKKIQIINSIKDLLPLNFSRRIMK